MTGSQHHDVALAAEPAEIAAQTRTASGWRADAACRGADTAVFFTQRGESTKPAMAYCDRCPVRQECLAENVGEIFGIFGGMSGRERRAERKRLRRMAAAPTGMAAYVRPGARFEEFTSRTHGLRSTYVDGCSCPECVAAERVYSREKKRRYAAERQAS